MFDWLKKMFARTVIEPAAYEYIGALDVLIFSIPGTTQADMNAFKEEFEYCRKYNKLMVVNKDVKLKSVRCF